jgi:hypothetical protein
LPARVRRSHGGARLIIPRSVVRIHPGRDLAEMQALPAVRV